MTSTDFENRLINKLKLYVEKYFCKRNWHEKISKKGSHYFPGKFLNVKILNPKCLKLPSNVLTEIKTSESSQQNCQNSQFKILDYFPCLCKIPIQNYF